MTGGSLPDIDDLNIARLLATRQPVRDMLLPPEDPFVIVERLKLRLETGLPPCDEALVRTSSDFCYRLTPGCRSPWRSDQGERLGPRLALMT